MKFIEVFFVSTQIFEIFLVMFAVFGFYCALCEISTLLKRCIRKANVKKDNDISSLK